MLETKLFYPVKDFLEQAGFKVYAEVLIKQTSRTVDVVGLNEKVSTSVAVELKTKFNKKLQEQARFNASLFDLSYIAIPKGVKFTPIAGVGVLVVDVENHSLVEVCSPSSSAFRPSFTTLKARLFINSLNNHIPGGLAAQQATSAKHQVLSQIINYLTLHGPTLLPELVANIHVHYQYPEKAVRELINAHSTELVLTATPQGAVISLKV
jgi:hypothetical protein